MSSAEGEKVNQGKQYYIRSRKEKELVWTFLHLDNGHIFAPTSKFKLKKTLSFNTAAQTGVEQYYEKAMQSPETPHWVHLQPSVLQGCGHTPCRTS